NARGELVGRVRGRAGRRLGLRTTSWRRRRGRRRGGRRRLDHRRLGRIVLDALEHDADKSASLPPNPDALLGGANSGRLTLEERIRDRDALLGNIERAEIAAAVRTQGRTRSSKTSRSRRCARRRASRNFAWRVEDLVMTGGFALVTGDV